MTEQKPNLSEFSNFDLLEYVYRQYYDNDPTLPLTDTCLIEELNELSAEISRMYRKRATREKLAYEIKDVEYLLYQFKEKYGLTELVRIAMLEEIKKVPDKIKKAQQLKSKRKFDPFEFFDLYSKSDEELSKIASQPTLDIDLDDVLGILDADM